MKICFDNGLDIEAPDATGVLDALALVQPDPVKDGAQMKRVLTLRAEAWNGSVLDPSMDDDAFVAAAAAAGLFTLDHTTSTEPL